MSAAPEAWRQHLEALLETVENESLRFGTRSNQDHWGKTAAARQAVVRFVESLLAEREQEAT